MSHIDDRCLFPYPKRDWPIGMLWSCDCGKVYRLRDKRLNVWTDTTLLINTVHDAILPDVEIKG
jgi:hypothetical protein